MRPQMPPPQREAQNGVLGWIAVRGDSMWPTLRSADAVLCECVAVARPGEIVVAKLPSGVVAHRVVSWSAGGVVLRGDNTASNDATVCADRVLGRVTRVRRGDREASLADLDVGPRLVGRARLQLKRVLSRLARRLG